MSGTRAYSSKPSPLILWVRRVPLFQEALAGVPALILWVRRAWATPWAGDEVVRAILGRALPDSMCGSGPVGAALPGCGSGLGGVAHSIETHYRRIGGIMRKRLNAQRR